MIARTKPPNRRRKGGARRGPWRSESKRRFIGGLPCLITGKASQCSHVVNNGMRSKGSDEFTVPLSPEMHDQLDGRAKLPDGTVGKIAFVTYYDIDLLDAAKQLHERWLKTQRKVAA